LSGVDLSQAAIRFTENDFEFSFGGRKISGAMIIVGRFVVLTKQIGLSYD
jgi:hypothetical protein